MEKRFLLFILICVTSFLVYGRLLGPRSVPPGNPPGSSATGSPERVDPSAAGDPGARSPENAAPGSGDTPSPIPALPSYPLKSVVLSNDSLELDLRSDGAGIHSAIFSKYLEGNRENALIFASPELQSGTGLVVAVSGIGSGVPLDTVRWELIEQSDGRVVFRHPLGEGGSITKEIVLPPEGYEVVVSITIDGEFSAARDARYQFLGFARIRYEDGSRGPNQRVAGLLDRNGLVTDTDHEGVGPLPQRFRVDERSIAWGGLESNYFASVIRPEPVAGMAPPRLIEIADPDRTRAPEYKGAHEKGRQEYPYRVGFQQTVVPGRTDVYRVFLGPKDREVLAAYEDHGYLELIDYGTLGPLVRLFLFLLRTFEAVTSSWGVAIILLTVIVKSLLHPINKRNQRSMQRQQKKMAKIQPEMKAIKEKHKNDALKANQEIQRLFKEHGVNPAQMFGGCLMLFFQLPIWIGLINTFRVAIELRQASFLWVADLTAPDQVFQMPFKLPFLGDWFNVLPLLYVIVTLVNQRMMPRSDDPQMRQQQKMMTFMMVAFGFIFYSFPSGLMVYFLTSASLGIVEQKIIRAELKHEDAKAAEGPAPPPPPAPGKGKRRS